ncbi:uncharacterized protein LAESUDRAFT_763145 [Laetiporus sulphureus 93-53]|uniref:Uncharacterized protein n=1 Tax=Laetiporus sulphureus 93-53 TaxID=1314785 RepID=A0A165C1J3_9APHY|nr:uncharacterized protein LAESUDRAFT_763145 [Laetiporus sulphureus 93-53]KZT02035.1 hypothetical protein LAESUDRAFT_763145 [Laetiporus sulphureus 93-53]
MESDGTAPPNAPPALDTSTVSHSTTPTSATIEEQELVSVCRELFSVGVSHAVGALSDSSTPPDLADAMLPTGLIPKLAQAFDESNTLVNPSRHDHDMDSFDEPPAKRRNTTTAASSRKSDNLSLNKKPFVPSSKPELTPSQGEPSSRTTSHRHDRRKRTKRVDCRPFPTAEEADSARRGVMYFGFYIGNRLLEKVAIAAAAGLDDNDLELNGLVYLQRLVNDYSIDDHFAYVSAKAKEQIPQITEDVDAVVPVLTLFKLDRDAFYSRISAKKAQMLADALGHQPIWWEIAQLL